ncbi:hypothetical protein D9M71_334630 [compost metagenome]
MVRADQHGGALGQAKLLHHRLGETHRLVGHYAPDQARALDAVEQFEDAVVRPSEYRAMFLVAVEEFLAQVLEAGGFRVHIEGCGNHGAGAAGDDVLDQLVVDRRFAVGGQHGLADGDEVGRRVQQGAIHVEENRFQLHAFHSSRRVWIM